MVCPGLSHVWLNPEQVAFYARHTATLASEAHQRQFGSSRQFSDCAYSRGCLSVEELEANYVAMIDYRCSGALSPDDAGKLIQAAYQHVVSLHEDLPEDLHAPLKAIGVVL